MNLVNVNCAFDETSLVFEEMEVAEEMSKVGDFADGFLKGAAVAIAFCALLT